jgi:hypothetical protein
MTALLRSVAIAVAVAALIDPAMTATRRVPVAIDVRTDGSGAADALRSRLIAGLGPDVDAAGTKSPEAIVVVGDRAAVPGAADGVPVFFVADAPGPNVRILSAGDPQPLIPGQSVAVNVEIEAVGVAGKTSTIALEQAGVELGRVEQRWADGARVRVSIPYVPPSAGLQTVRVIARPIDGETRADDNAADVTVKVASRPLRIAVIEPRPSWTAGFVRRVLEADAAFNVSSLQHASRGVTAEAGAPPRVLTAAGLERFDAVLIGAPEDLRPADVSALDAFASQRGGAVVLLPDRRPSGPYQSLVPAGGFQEILLETPAPLDPSTGLRASELVLPQDPAAGATTLARLPGQAGAIVWWPAGEGRIVFSGALDAWRFRAQDEGAFARFWRDTIAAAALAAPERIDVEVEPRVVAPGGGVRVRARVRPTELVRGADGLIVVPAVRAEATAAASGDVEPVRLWPAAEPGVFEGRFAPAAAGRYVLRIATDRGAAVETTVHADDQAAQRPADHAGTLRLVAEASGGAFATAADVSSVMDRLRALPRRQAAAAVHPMRSGWWVLPFAAALTGEWALRRRRGLR